MRSLCTFAWEWGPLTALAVAGLLVSTDAGVPPLAVGAFFTSLAVFQYALVKVRWERDSLAEEVRVLRRMSGHHEPTSQELARLHTDLEAWQRGEQPW